jgi:hypothetical protein
MLRMQSRCLAALAQIVVRADLTLVPDAHDGALAPITRHTAVNAPTAGCDRWSGGVRLLMNVHLEDAVIDIAKSFSQLFIT